MIKLSNDHKLEFVAASGALGFDGKGYWWDKPLKFLNLFDVSLFTPTTKTLTYLPERGNCRYGYDCIKFIKNGVLNAMGLPNPGIDDWTSHNKDFNGIVSIYPEIIALPYVIEKIEQTRAKAIELNVSCPNKKILNGREIENILSITKTTRLPIILKLSVMQELDFNLDNVEAISINSVPWRLVYHDKISPFVFLGGGALSGKIVQPYTWKFINYLIKTTNVPVIGCSVWNYQDIDKLYDMGCKAISFGSIFLKYPWKPTVFVRRYRNEMRRYNKTKR